MFSPASYHGICADLALKTGAAVVFPEYTFVPDAHFPTQHEECYSVVKWVHTHGKSVGLNAHRIAVVGDSAGGMLSSSRV
jgi:acetyl esterase